MPMKKQAVVLVHGMGQQVPMETLRGFVQTMWVEDPDIKARLTTDPIEIKGNPVWWKPDGSSGSLELSRITTRHIHADDTTIVGPRTDFYELYWADVTEGNTLAQLKDWFLKLMWRPWREVPRHVAPIWILLWLATILLAGLWSWKGLAGGLCPKDAPSQGAKSFFGDGCAATLCEFLALPTGVTVALWVLTIVAPLFLAFAVNYFGDVARYTRAAPANIVARRAARERGLALLRRLTESGEYDRIVLVGHSLGSILAYDILKFLWSEREDMRRMAEGSPLHDAWRAVETAAAALRQSASEPNLETYRVSQRDLFAALSQQQGKLRWIISDFVTLGSPLAHAEFLLERESKAFEGGIAERRFPSSPPRPDPPNDLIYQDSQLPGGRPQWRAHHATPFAAIRWTNIYDRRCLIVFGDLVSGPVARLFGPAVEDREVSMRSGALGRIFTHTLYWTDSSKDAPQLPLLREALNLRRR